MRIFIFFLLFQLPCYAETYVYLNGEKIEVESVRQSDGIIRITTKKKMTICRELALPSFKGSSKPTRKYFRKISSESPKNEESKPKRTYHKPNKEKEEKTKPKVETLIYQ